MFESEAEEIANKKLCAKMMCYGHCSFSSPKHHRCGEWHRCYEIAKEGIEFGYNKAKEDADKMKSQFLELCNLKDMRIKELEKANEWHYPSKGELPQCDETKKLWLYFKDYYANDRDCEHPFYRTSTGVYKTSFLNENVKLFAEKTKGYESEILLKDVIAWKEIVLPKENE